MTDETIQRQAYEAALQPLTEQQVIAVKMRKIMALSDAILRAHAAYDEHPAYEQAAFIQKLWNQRAELQATLPKLRAVQ